MKTFRELTKMPWIQFFTSAACNLKCEYCSQVKNHHHAITSDSFTDPQILKMLGEIPPTSFYVSGGEPLIHSGVEDFVKIASDHGHYINFDTNIIINYKKLENLLKSWKDCNIGMFNISHHIVENIKLPYVIKRSELLRDYGHRVLVKYVGTPDHIEVFEHNLPILRDNGFGTATTLCNGKWRGRDLPLQYTDDELFRLFNLLTLGSHALQFFRGIPSKGMLCRGGQDFVVYNMHEDKQYIPCCHGTGFELELKDTFFRTGDNKPKHCKIDECRGDLMMIMGLNNVKEEIERFDQILDGNYDFIGVENAIEHLESIRAKGFKFVHEDHYLSFRDYARKRLAASSDSNKRDYYRKDLINRQNVRIEKEKQELESKVLYTDKGLRTQLTSEIKGLEDALNANKYFKITDLLRQYAFSKMKWSEDGINRKLFAPDGIDKLSVSKLTFLLDTNEIGLLCGDVAIYLKKLYELFGFPACTYNYGIKDLLSHVVTLVGIPQQNSYKIVIQDAATNVSFKFRTSTERDFLGIWSLLKSGRVQDIQIIDGKNTLMTMLFSNNPEGLDYLNKCKEIGIIKSNPEAISSKILDNEIVSADGDLGFVSSFLRRYDLPIRQALSKINNIPVDMCNPLQLMLYTISISKSGNAVFDQRMDRIRKANLSLENA